MATGYLVTLGDGLLDVGDTISGTAFTFVDDVILGAGRWVFSGGGFTNESEPGQYILAQNGNIYFVPDLGVFGGTTVITGSVEQVPPLGPDGTVSGTTGDDTITFGYNDDPTRETITRDDDIVQAGAGNDSIAAASGNDSIDAGDGNDVVSGGAGNDTIDGAAGNDVLIGDQMTNASGEDSISGGEGDDVIYGDNLDVSGSTAETTVFQWSTQGFADDADISSGLTGLTANGDVRVTLSVDEGSNFDTSTMDTSSALFDYNAVSDTSSIEIVGGAAGTTTDAGTIRLDFSAGTNGFVDEVEDVTFAIFDLDQFDNQFQDQIVVRAYDAEGNLIPVNLTLFGQVAGSETIFVTDNGDGSMTATAGATAGNGSAASASGTVQVFVAGPVAQIEIEYNNTDPVFGAHAINLGDIQLTSIPATTTDGAADTIDGGIGNDEIFGQGGDDSLQGGTGEDTLYGGTGNDVIDDSGITADSIFGGDGDDTITAGDGADQISGDAGNDSIRGEAGNDVISGDAGNDNIRGDGGDDSISGGTGNDTIQGNSGNDTLNGDAGEDTLTGGTGNDVLDGGADNDRLTGSSGDDTLISSAGDDVNFGGTGNDTFVVTDDSDGETITGGEDTGDGDIDVVTFGTPTSTDGVTVNLTGAEAGTYDYDGTTADGSFTQIERLETTDNNDTIDASLNTGGMTFATGAGDDTITGGQGDEVIDAGTGDDTVSLNDGFGTDTIVGGEDTGGGDVDVLDAMGITSDIVVNLSAAETGTLTTGTNTATFSEIEEIALGSGDDSVTGSAGNDTVDLGQGTDTINAGAGDDVIDLGQDSPGIPDGDADVVVLEDGFGDDIVQNFDAPVVEPDGSLTGVDTLDVTNLTAGGAPVTVDDVTVTDDGSGNAVLTFPAGESITLVGISPTDADDPFYLQAIGIPGNQDGIVSGDASDNTIDLAYTGDPDGDLVDADDALLAGEVANDDIIEGLGGNDTIFGGDGDDQIFGDASAQPDAGIGEPIDQLFTDATNIQSGSFTSASGTTSANDAGVGDSIIFDNAATLADGSSVAIRVTVVSISDPDVTVELDNSQASSPLRVIGGPDEIGDTVEFKVEFIDQATGEPLTLTGNATIVDIDDNASIGITGAEFVQFDTNNINSYSVSGGTTSPSTLTVVDNGSTVTATGTENNGSSDQDAWFGVGFTDQSEINFTVGVVDGTANYGFSGLDLTDPVTTEVTGGNDVIDGGVGNDYIAGNAGDDTLTGGDGDDTILGGTGTDTIFGGSGDTIIGGEDADGLDVDVLNAGVAVSVDYTDVDGNPVTGPSEYGTVTYVDGTTLSFSEIETLNVSLLDGTVSGTAGDDVIDGSYMGDPDGDIVDNNDAILAGDTGNDDLIFGYAGNDTILAGDGNDEAFGGTDNDSIDGGVGNDVLYGDDNPTLPGGADPATSTYLFSSTGDLQLYDAATGTVTPLASGLQNYGDIAVASDGTIYGILFNDGNDAVYQIDPTTGVETLAFDLPDAAGNNADLTVAPNGNIYLSNDTTGDVTMLVPDGSGGFTNAGSVGTVQGSSKDLVFVDEDTIWAVSGGVIYSYDVAPDGTLSNEVNLGTVNGDPNIWGLSIDADGTVYAFQDSGEVLSTDPTALPLAWSSEPSAVLPNGGSIYGAAGLFETGTYVPGDGDDIVNGGAGDDTLFGGAGNDTLDGGADNDTVFGGIGDDTIVVTDGFGDDVIAGGEDVGAGDVDVLDGSGLTEDVAVDLTAPETGTISNGTDTASFAEIEEIALGSGDDSVTGSAGNDTVDLGQGADTISGGAGDDVIDLGEDSPGVTDGDPDVVVLEDGFGDDIIANFDAPTVAPNGSLTGIDMLDVTDLFDRPAGDPTREPVNTNDVTVTDDGSGNAVLTFPNGESITLIGIPPADADNPLYLNAIGIPLPDGTVSGDNTGNLIDGSYLGDPDGDIVDNNDAILAGDTGNDDLIEANGGDDTVFAGDGNDEVYGGTGNDTLDGGVGNDTLVGDAGSDTFTIAEADGTDAILGFGDASGDDVDVVDFSGVSGSDGVAVTFTDDEDGTYQVGTSGSDGQFDEIEGIVGTDNADTIDLSGDSAGIIVDAGAGADTLTSGQGDDTLTGGTGSDTFNIDQTDGTDTITGGEDVGGGDTDTIDFADVTSTDGATVSFTGDEAGTYTAGTSGGTFTEIEAINGTANADNVDLTGDTTGIEATTGAGDDTVTSGAGNDDIATGTGQDDIVINDNFGDDTIDGGTGADGTGDVLDGSGLTQDVTVDISTPETGTVTNGSDTLSFAEIEAINTGSGDDTVTGSAGNDTVDTGAGNDIIAGGAGDDSIVAGTGNDTITVTDTFGDDTVDAGEDAGNGDIDVLDGSGLTDDVTVTLTGDEVGTVTDGVDTLSFNNVEEIVTGSGDDTIVGGTGDDSVSTGAGNDVIDGGAGNDTFDAGAGNDTINGGTGDDNITAGTGDDTIVITDTFGNDTVDAGEDAGNGDTDVLDGSGLTDDVTVTLTGDEVGTVTDGVDTLSFDNVEEIVTGSGDDTIIGGIGDDSVTTGAGNDVITGGAGDDTFAAGAGDDSIAGGTGADTITAGDGNDTITFAEGDSVSGGDGDDLFVLEDLGEPSNGVITVTGGDGDESPVDPINGTGGDILQLGTLADLSTLVQIPDGLNASGNPTFSGSVTLDDGTILNFSGIEQVICFTPGTNIATPQGSRPIETLKVGDLVVTRDHGLQPIRWIQSRTVPATDKFAPVRLRPGTVTGLERDLLVSPQHRMLFQGYRAELLFGESEVLMPATHLVDNKMVTREEGGFITYIHMMFDEHEVIYAEGAASESFHPGEIGLTGVSDAAREELFALFPQLRSDPKAYGRTARRTLKKHESQMLRTK